jgi:hypothetical protein
LPRISDLQPAYLSAFHPLPARAESTNALYKTELVRQQGPWRGVDDLELATLGWVHWFNSERLHGTLDDIPPVSSRPPIIINRRPADRLETNEPSLHQTQGASDGAGFGVELEAKLDLDVVGCEVREAGHGRGGGRPRGQDGAALGGRQRRAR